MNLNTTEDKARLRRDKAKEAIALALESRWEEALALNREIVAESPKDVEAFEPPWQGPVRAWPVQARRRTPSVRPWRFRLPT